MLCLWSQWELCQRPQRKQDQAYCEMWGLGVSILVLFRSTFKECNRVFGKVTATAGLIQIAECIWDFLTFYVPSAPLQRRVIMFLIFVTTSHRHIKWYRSKQSFIICFIYSVPLQISNKSHKQPKTPYVYWHKSSWLNACFSNSVCIPSLIIQLLENGCDFRVLLRYTIHHRAPILLYCLMLGLCGQSQHTFYFLALEHTVVIRCKSQETIALISYP